eukprot:1881172-Amphidinium_carterae.1
MSDAGITGFKNRGHVSRCRHVAQYLHECGATLARIVRLEGGLNAWKLEGLDGILGDQRLMYAGQLHSVGAPLPSTDLPDDAESTKSTLKRPALTLLPWHPEQESLMIGSDVEIHGL